MASIKKAIADVGSGNAVAFATGKVKILRYSMSAQFFGAILAPSLS